MIETTRFGRIEVDDDRVLIFPKGLIGFASQERFIILDHAPNSPIHWLQSVELGDLAFPTADPKTFIADYRIILPEGLENILGEFSPEDLWTGVIISFPQNKSAPSLNLKAPLLINTRTRIGTQLILEDPKVPIRFLLEESSRP